MKRTGPPRKPTALKLIEGTWRADRAPRNEARPAPELPPIPQHLSGEARKEWRRVARRLSRLGLLSSIDRAALAVYCECWADWVEASRRCVGADGKDLKVIKTGEKIKYETGPDGQQVILERSGGNFVENPYFTIKKRSAEIMHKFLIEFGMTPAARTRINVYEEEKQKDPAERFFA
jgi:P27 family predicted phage terminase small subunit